MVNPSVLKGRARQAENPAAKASRNARFLGHGAVECQSKQGKRPLAARSAAMEPVFGRPATIK
jgi:hypothetical protein